jgi:hypothetical protein
LNSLGWKLFNAFFPRILESFARCLAAKRIEWEIDDFNRSNLKLYPILGECYEVFQSMKGFSEEDKVYKQAFIRVCDNKGYKFKDSTHLMVRVVKYVFGIEDSKRISAYAMALRVAAEEGIKTENLAEYLFKNGGPEEVRRNKGKKPNKKDDSAENKSDAMSNDQKGRAAIYGEVLATFDAPDLMKKFDSGFYHGSVLLLATVETEGSFAIRRLIQDSVVIKTAYTKLASSVSKNEMAKLLAEDDAKLKAAYLETK